MKTELRCAIELRSDETRTSPGRIVGTLIEYEKRAGDRPEVFREGALSWPEGGIILNMQHDRKQPILRFTPELRGKEIIIDEALPDTSQGRDVAVMVKNGTLRGLSVEFRSQRESRQGGVRQIEAARLYAAGLVDDSSYQTKVEVRDRDRGGPRFKRWL